MTAIRITASIDALTIRPATAADARSLLDIYAPYVEASAVSFEIVTPSVDEFAGRITKALTRWQWLVAEVGGQAAGFAYGTSHRERAAYRWSVEVSAYVSESYQRHGIGRALYLRLLSELGSLGFCNAYAGIVLPNDGSVALHRSVGFEPIGTFTAVGRKFGKWHDVAWFQRRLRQAPPDDA